MRLALKITPREIVQHTTKARFQNHDHGATAQGQLSLEDGNVVFRGMSDGKFVGKVQMDWEGEEGFLDKEIEVESNGDDWYSVRLAGQGRCGGVLSEKLDQEIPILSFHMPNLIFEQGT